MTMNDYLFSIIIVLLGAIGYFIKRILDKTDGIENDVADMRPKVKVLWERSFANANSPLALNERGKELLYGGGVKDMVDANLSLLTERLRGEKPENAYQLQERAMKVVKVLAEDPKNLSKLEDGAFQTGVNVDALLFAAGIYLRDLTLPKYEFKLEDIDHQAPPVS
jgi:hypothetical protein